jgi:hypothetical protein
MGTFPYAPVPWYGCGSYPRCDGQLTTEVVGWGLLPPILPLVACSWSSSDPIGTSTVSVSAPLFDAGGRTIPMTVYYRHLELLHWEYRAQVIENGVDVDLGSGRLVFASDEHQ